MSSQDLEAKIVVLGSSGVGKTSLLSRFVHNKFLPPSMSVPTVGATFLTKRLVSPDTNIPTDIRLQIWDTAGQERFRSISKLYYRGANAALLCYDITDETSFLDMGTWMEELKRNCGDDCIIHVVGTKADIVAEDPKRRKVPFERCIQYVAKELHGAKVERAPLVNSVSNTVSRTGSIMGDVPDLSLPPFEPRAGGIWDIDTIWDSCHEISTKDGDGVDEIFRVVTRKLAEQHMEQESRAQSQAEFVAKVGDQDASRKNSADSTTKLEKSRGLRLSIGDTGFGWLNIPIGNASSQVGGMDNKYDHLNKSGRCC